MFGLFSKSTPKGSGINFASLKTDMHSHLLPGIDDGSPDLETSIELIRGMKALGYEKLITTPHIMWDMYRNTPDVINRKLDLVREALQKEGIDIELHAAAEYFLDEHVEELLREKKPLLTISGNKVLVEFSMAFPSMNIKDILFEMEMQGYQPVIAHPERYVYLQRNRDFYDELRTVGCIFQLNLLSMSGHYGKSVHELAQYLLKSGYYELIGTDLHHSGHLNALGKISIPPALKTGIESGKILNNTL